jgi:adenylate cyclase
LSLFNELKRRNVLRVGAAYVVVAWLFIQVTETIFPLFGFDDTPARIVVIVLAIGFFPTLIFAWAFEMTPEGLKKESEVDRTQSLTPHTGKKLDRMIMVVLALALGYFAFDKFVLNPQREAALQQLQIEQLATVAEQSRQEGRTEALVESYGEKSIAVLAFDDMSQAGDQEYLSDGIAEELLNLLAKIPELRVISRSSAFSFKGKDLEIPEIAERLNVAHILEGSVRKAGSKVRITTQLIEARSDTHLWSETYDRQLDDIFAIQDEIAATVVEQLKITLLGAVPHVEETDPEAYALYLRAVHLGRLSSAESLEQSITLFQEVLAIDPNYASAWSGLARNYIDQTLKNLRTSEEGWALAREAAEKALAINPEHAIAHSMLGWIAVYKDNDLSAAARHNSRALALEPTSPSIIGNATQVLSELNHLDQAITAEEYVTVRDPLNPISYQNLGFSYLTVGRWDDAIASYQTALQLSPGIIGTHYYIGVALLLKGNIEAALAEFEQEEDEEFRTKGQAMALYALGRQDVSKAKLQELIERWGDEWPSEVAHVYAYTGNADAAFNWLEKSAAEEDGGFQPQQKFLDSLRDDPRWLPLLEQMGKSPAQLDAIEFNVTLPK